MNLRSLFIFGLMMMCSRAFALYGGRPLKNGEHEAVASLHLRDGFNPNYDYFCSGVLISPQVIITAAHCIEGMGNLVYDNSPHLSYHPELIRVGLKGRKLEVKEVTIAPSYFESSGHAGEDLALIVLKSPVTNVKPLPLALKADLKVGTALTMVSRGMVASTQLLTKTNHRTATTLVTQGRSSGTCLGDSGGALLIEKNGQFALAGILTFSGDEGCEVKNTVSVFPKAQF